MKEIERTIELLDNFNLDQKKLYIKLIPFIQEVIVELLRPSAEEVISWKTSSLGRVYFSDYINNKSKKRISEKQIDALWNYYTGNVNTQRSKALISEFKRLNNNNEVCKFCAGNTNLQVDHIIPLVRGGIDEIDNLQYLCAKCNSEKHGSYDFLELICQ